MENGVYVIPAFGIIALAFIFIRSSWVSRQDEGDC